MSNKNENDMSSERSASSRQTLSENDMSDEELEDFEKKSEVREDVYDSLERFRLFLNNTRTEQMYHLKRSTKLGPQCPYYIKSKRLFEQNELEILKKELQSILTALDGLNKL